MSKEALLIIDVQKDFCPGGSLPVKEGDQVIEPLNKISAKFRGGGKPVYVSRDWHKKGNTTHMNPNKWPEHCIEGSEGAQFHEGLDVEGALIISKGLGDGDDGYSAFEGRLDDGRTLEQALKEDGVQGIIAGGLATDYCVRASVLDAHRLGLNVTVILDAVRAVDLKPGDGDKAITEMKQAGAKFVRSEEIVYQV